jgi:hypothetical protein
MQSSKLHSVNINDLHFKKNKNLLKRSNKNTRILIAIYDDNKTTAKTLSLKIHSCNWIL